MGLEGKAAIVTGGGQGIGRAIALRLARDGADVLVADLNAETAAKVAGEVREMGRRAAALAMDVTQAADIARLVQTAMGEWGQIDILVNNAGIVRVTDPFDITERDWDTVMAVNTRAVFFCSQAVLREMVKRKTGRIVNISSQAGKFGNPLYVHYCASKAAVISITKSLALAVARDGIRVNCICPGFVETDMWSYIDSQVAPREGLPPGGAFQKRIQTIPVGRAEKPEDVANVVSFLCSEDSDYMTGQAINVTGGYTMY